MDANGHQKNANHPSRIMITAPDYPGVEIFLTLRKKLDDSILEIKYPSGQKASCLVSEFLSITDK